LGISHGDEAPQPSDLAGCEEQFRYGKGKVVVLRGSISETWTDDIGSNYFKTYELELRMQIGRLAESLGIFPLTAGPPTGLVGVFPIRQPDHKRLVVHLVNYDIDYAKDAIREKTDVAITVQRPAFLPRKVVARLHTPNADPQLIEIVSSPDRLQLSVPRLGVWASVIVAEE
jgi:hypothetical protein